MRQWLRSGLIAAAAVVVGVALPGCQLHVRTGTPCRGHGWGTNGTWTFQCVGGRWIRKSTNAQMAALLIAVARSHQPDDVTTLAGATFQQPAFADGTGSAAHFMNPKGLAVSPDGTIYVADVNNDAIRRVTPSGQVSTLARSAGGCATTEPICDPSAVAVDHEGNIVAALGAEDTIIRIAPNGTVTTIAGNGSMGSRDGVGTVAQFDIPYGVAIDANDDVIVADTFNNTIRKVTPDGTVTTLAGAAGQEGAVDGSGDDARFNQPQGIAMASNGDIIVADYGNHTIRRLTPGGVVTTVAGLAGTDGSADGTTSAARFFAPEAVATAADGRIYVADTGNDTIRRIALDGTVTTIAGTARIQGATDDVGAAARFDQPDGITLDPTGTALYVSDALTSTIRRITNVT